MTVKELRNALADMDNDMEVVLYDYNDRMKYHLRELTIASSRHLVIFYRGNTLRCPSGLIQIEQGT